jgi:hypothetical protein
MPWHTESQHPDCPSDRPWAVVKDDDGEVEGCHATEEEANAQVAALYASEEDMAADPILTAVYDAFADEDDGVANRGAERDPALYSQGYWQGVLAVETVETGDYPRREFADGALEWREPPLSMFWQKKTAEGHDEAFIVAKADEMWRAPVTLKDGRTVPGIWGRGNFNMKQPEGVEAHQLVLDRFMRGASVTLDDVTDHDVEYIFPEGTDTAGEDDELMALLAEPEKILYHHGRVMDALFTAQPALQEAEIELIADADWVDRRPDTEDAEAMVAAGDGQWEGLVVVAKPAEPGLIAVEGGLEEDELHVTLGYFGKAADADPALIENLRQWVDNHGDVDFTARLNGVARMGNDDPQAVVLLAEAVELADLRADLETVADPDRTHPHFTPHVTIGYGIDMPDDFPDEARFDRVELWAGDMGKNDESVTAAAAPVLPPVGWFRNPGLTGPTPLTVGEDGRVFGHLAVWGVCHTSFSNVCVTAPRAPNGDYGYYRKGLLRTAEGEDVAVGQLTLGANHAPAHLGSAPAADHYDHTGHAVADVAAGEDDYGIWVAGATRPNVSESTMRVLRAGGISGDWRKVAGHWRLVGGLIVNVPGFPIPRVRTYVSDGEQTALVASGMVLPAAPSNVVPFGRRLADQLRAGIGRDLVSRAAELRRSVHHPTNHHK